MKVINLAILIICLSSFTMCTQKNKTIDIAFISAANEYVSHITLKEYKKELELSHKNVKVHLLQAGGPVNQKDEYSELQGTEILQDCDVMLVFARRTTISGKALEDIRAFVASGKPIVALRTASHGFQGWPEFDKDVLGGNYHGHYPGEPEKRKIGEDGMRYLVGEASGPVQQVTVNPANKSHPILKGVKDFTSKYSLYMTSPIASDAKLLLTGTIPAGSEPVAWTRSVNNARIVYIALGGFQDWQNPEFKKLLTNALFWAADVKAKGK